MSDLISREEAIEAVHGLRVKTEGSSDFMYNVGLASAEQILTEIPSADAEQVEWIGGDGDEMNEMNRGIIKDILKIMPTAYLLESLGVATFEELMESADNEESTQKCSNCHKHKNSSIRIDNKAAMIISGNQDRLKAFEDAICEATIHMIGGDTE